MRPLYANLVRTYNGKPTLYEAARELETVTIRTDMTFGGPRSFWSGSPILEVPSEPGVIIPEVMALSEPVERDIEDPAPVLFDVIVQAIEDAWEPDAFHLVFHSSGWDSRIISAAIKKLVEKHGTDWLGEGLFFLSNRWEASTFIRIMEAMGWSPSQYATLTEGPAEEHFAKPAYDVWRCAPIPRPGNFFWYLSTWAEEKGFIPSENVQAFTGLWANELWYWYFPVNQWVKRATRKYRWHMIAAQPIKAQWVEHPLVALPVLEVLRRAQHVYRHGNILREAVAHQGFPEAKPIKNQWRLNDGSHPISERLQQELDAYYKQTVYGQHSEWQVPSHSGSTTDWCKWSMALLVEKLIEGGTECMWKK